MLSAPFPITRASFARKALRDLTGQTLVKQRFGHCLDGFRARQPGEPALSLLIEELARDRRFLLGNVLGLAVFAAAGGSWVWLTLWLLPMATSLPFVSRISNIAEHALIRQNEADPLRQARTTSANWLERALVAWYWMNYQCEHPMFAQLACCNPPRAHRMLARRPVTARMQTERGNVALLTCAHAA